MKNGFTLSEVLISLVIIGVIAAITVPSIIQNTKEKELEAGLKKHWSVIQNALRQGQLDEGALGDNSAVFTPDSSDERNYNTAKKFAKYLNTMQICTNKQDSNCSEVYHDIKYATNYNNGSPVQFSSYSAIALADGSMYYIKQNPECEWIQDDCKQDSEGNCLKDEDGNTIPQENARTDCGVIVVDVNGRKGPNKLGKDVFVLMVYSTKIGISTWAPYNGKKHLKWLYGDN